jgi:hypothetical protein
VQAPVSILTSGIGLGVYLPALFVRDQLHGRGIPAEVETLEGHYTEEGRRRHLAHKSAFHDNFQLALMAQRLARGPDAHLDEASLAGLFARWASAQRTRFIVWSGFWLPLLSRYQQMTGTALQIDCCRIDAIISPSFRSVGPLPAGASEIWLWSWADRRTVFEIPVDDRAPVPFSARRDRVVVHGGGWGIGTYRQARARLGEAGWALDVVVHDRAEVTPRPRDRHFLLDPTWRTWSGRGSQDGDSDGYTFPPLLHVEDDAMLTPGRHALFDVIRESKAIVSKPGGGTLIDSLASATPVVLLEPLGEAEARNGALWEELGFGIAFSRWCESGCSEAVLAGLHENLRRRRPGPHYPEAYARRLIAEAA